MKLIDYIKKRHCGNQAAFAASQGVKPQQVTKWLNMDCVVVDGVLYSPRRSLEPEKRPKTYSEIMRDGHNID